MGTPHSSWDSYDVLDGALLILRAYTKFISKPAKLRVANEADILKTLALRFEYVDPRVPILSVYETKEIKIRETIFSSRKVVASID